LCLFFSVTCKAKSADFAVDSKMPVNAAGLTTNFAQGTDLVFVALPCKSDDIQPSQWQDLLGLIAKFSENCKRRLFFIQMNNFSYLTCLSKN